MQLIQPTDERLLLNLSLNRLTFLRYSEKKILAKKLDSSRSLALLSIEEIEKIINRDIKKNVVWNGSENLRMVQKALYYCRLLNVRVILNDDEDYPELLRQIADPPYLLFCRGNQSLLCQHSVSVVGTRRLSQEGKMAARQFAYDAVMNGCNVVSGLANGADGFAHQGAMDAYFDCLDKQVDPSQIGRTIAVIPSSIDDVIPSCHKTMAGKILQTGGCIISEYEPGLQMANWHFVGRNRIIAGLSPATVVIEAPNGSGALITADFALEYNRDLLFHKAGFSPSALKIAEIVKNQLERDFVSGRVSKYKIENTITKFLEAGAAVIENYNDFCNALTECPGTRKNDFVQGLLFEV